MSKKSITRHSTMEKRGVQEDGTHAAHKYAVEVRNHIHAHTPGRSLGEENKVAAARQMNSAENLRIKTAEGNQVTDRRNDREIMGAISSDDGFLQTQAGVARAIQAYKGAVAVGDNVGVDAIGNLKIPRDEPGRAQLIKNAAGQ